MRRFLVLSWVAAASAIAAEPPHTVSLETVLEIARQKAPAIASARARVSREEERRHAATLFPDPRVTVGYGRGSPKDGSATGSETGFELSQSMPAPWGLGARRRVGEAQIDAARSGLDAVTRDVLLEAKTLYYEAALGSARASALVEAAVDAGSLSDLVQRRVAVGEAAGADHLRTRVEALRARSDALVAEAQAEGAREALNRFLLGGLGAEFRLPDGFDPARLEPVSEATIARALEDTPQVRAAAARVVAARAAEEAQRAERLPALDLTAFSHDEVDKRSSGVTLGFAIPLWNRNQPGVAIARAELVEAEADLAARRSEIATDLERLVRNDRAARLATISYQEEILPAARETLAIVRNSLEQGEASLLVWLEARRSYLETLRAAYETQLTAFVMRAELERLIGDSHASE